VETVEQFSNDGRPRRREYSKPVKAQVVAQCAQPGASVGGVALAHGLHSNMVHRWLREARQDQAFTLTASQGEPAAFVALPLPAPVSAASDQVGAAPYPSGQPILSLGDEAGIVYTIGGSWRRWNSFQTMVGLA